MMEEAIEQTHIDTGSFVDAAQPIGARTTGADERVSLKDSHVSVCDSDDADADCLFSHFEQPHEKFAERC